MAVWQKAEIQRAIKFMTEFGFCVRQTGAIRHGLTVSNKNEVKILAQEARWNLISSPKNEQV